MPVYEVHGAHHIMMDMQQLPPFFDDDFRSAKTANRNNDDDDMWKLFDAAFDGSHNDDEFNEFDDMMSMSSLTQTQTSTHGRTREKKQKSPPQQHFQTCPFCYSNHIDVVEGNYVCSQCNTVVTRMIDNSPEWRYYGAEDNRSVNPTRCAPPSGGVAPGLGASMSMSAPGGGAGGGISRTLQKLQMWNSMTHQERNLYHIFDSMAVAAANHGISLCLLEEAKCLYKRISEGRISRGENRKALIACSIYMACVMNGVPRTINEIVSMFDVKTPSMTYACKQFQDMLRINIASSKPADFIPRFCSKVGVGSDILHMCRHVIQVADELCLVTESTPPALVASVIYMCCCIRKVKVCKKHVAEACHLSQVTISKCHKRLVQHRDTFFPPDMDIDAWLEVATMSKP